MTDLKDKTSWSISELIEQMPAYKLMNIADIFGKNSNEFRLAQITYQAQREFDDTRFAKLKARNQAMLYKRGF